jgi:hypothetical protein
MDASYMDFAISTLAEQLMEALDAFEHWAGNTRAQIFAVLEPSPDARKALRISHTLGISLHITVSHEDHEGCYFSLAKVLSENARHRTQLSCVMDDDTFLPPNGSTDRVPETVR